MRATFFISSLEKFLHSAMARRQLRIFDLSPRCEKKNSRSTEKDRFPLIVSRLAGRYITDKLNVRTNQAERLKPGAKNVKVSDVALESCAELPAGFAIRNKHG